MDAEVIVNMAKLWKNVPDKKQCILSGSKSSDIKSQRNSVASLRRQITENDVYEIVFTSDNCDIASLEHVQTIVNVNHPSRGQIEVMLVSPSGTRTQMLAPRANDVSDKGFHNWALTSVETWGEHGDGTWHLYIVNRGDQVNWSVGQCTLVLHGVHKSVSS